MNPRNGSTNGHLSVDTWTREADAVSLPRIAEAQAAPRPATVGTTYSDKEYAALASEQELAWPAEGERTARPHQVNAEGLTVLADATRFLLVESEKGVTQTKADYHHAARTLTPHARREPGAKTRYWVVWILLVVGDLAGVWAAAVMLGEVVYIAVWMAMASGLSAGCAGLVGSELKHVHMARARQCDLDDLTEDERRYRRLFTAPDTVPSMTKLITLISLLVVALLAIGIFTLRAGVEGTEAALAYGLLAAATALASGLLGYSAADEVADLIATTEKRCRRAVKHHLRLAASAAPRDRARAIEEARSVKDEFALRGQAAAKRVDSLAWRIHRRNPHIMGHGFPADEPVPSGGAIGRKPRRGERA
jgi:hypothetical protein